MKAYRSRIRAAAVAALLLLLGAGVVASLLVWPRHPPKDFADPGGIVAFHVLWCYLLAALLLVRAPMRLPPLARRNAFRFTALVAAALLGVAMLVPNLVALGRNLDPELSPFNLAGIDFDDYVKPSSTSPGRWGPNIRFHALWAVSALALGLALNAIPFAKSLKKYLSR